jgi:hypothetical protein
MQGEYPVLFLFICWSLIIGLEYIYIYNRAAA